MSDLYAQQHYPRPQQHFMSYSSQLISQQQQQQQPQQQPQQQLSASSSPDDPHSTPTPAQATTPRTDQSISKPEGKPQATFLTKLYALLERPENHHMIRWDAEGKHIIVERPEQLALHVLPSIYRQSRFASFSRQLNIYGFMRKVNLRNVDPSIDDPDASTWSHPTLDRNSPPDVVANFKRRVPPRLPKPRKRPEAVDPNVMIPPRSAVGLGIPLTVPSSISVPSSSGGGFQRGRSRGFSAPGSFTPLSHNVPSPAQWGHPSYSQRQALPPLTVPSDSPSHLSHYNSQGHPSIPPITPTGDNTQSSGFSPSSYSATGSSGYSTYPPSSGHQYGFSGSESSANWNFPPLSSNSSGGHSSLSSLLNPPGNYAGRPSIQTSYSSHHHSYSSLANNQSPVSLSPDSRPTTGYSAASSMQSLPYDPSSAGGEYDSRPSSSHHGRPLTPLSRHSPIMKTSTYPSGLSVRRERRHSHAVSPYPSPYDSIEDRPMTAPNHPDSPPMSHQSSIPRVKSLMHVASTGSQSPGEGNSYSYQPAQADFAYSSSGASGNPTDSPGRPSWIQDPNNGPPHSVRPSTSTSSLSAASQSSTTSATHTPPAVMESGQYPETDINRFSPEFGIQRTHGMTPNFAKPLAVNV